MGDQPKLNSLLKWAVQNSDDVREDATTVSDPKTERDPARGLDAEALAELMGGPSDADRMRDAMAAILSSEVDLDNKLTAWDNFEQLIENIDNANYMESMGLWMPLVQQLHDSDPQLRRMAAWCCATAVQNNVKAQERLLVVGAIPPLTKMAREDPSKYTRKKSILALSSAVRNYQPGLDAALKELPADYAPTQKMDATDMEAVDTVIGRLREEMAAMP